MLPFFLIPQNEICNLQFYNNSYKDSISHFKASPDNNLKIHEYKHNLMIYLLKETIFKMHYYTKASAR